MNQQAIEAQLLEELRQGEIEKATLEAALAKCEKDIERLEKEVKEMSRLGSQFKQEVEKLEHSIDKSRNDKLEQIAALQKENERMKQTLEHSRVKPAAG